MTAIGSLETAQAGGYLWAIVVHTAIIHEFAITFLNQFIILTSSQIESHHLNYI